MAAYIYERCSTDEQVHSCTVQEDLCRKACKAQELGEPVVIKDDGVSTSKVPFNKRPGIIQLLSLLKPDDHLVVWRLDRIERGFLTFYDAIKQIVNKDVWIHSVEEKGGMKLDLSTAAGRAMLAIWQIASDFYREQVKENTRRAIQWRKDNGFAYTEAPFGFYRKALPLLPGQKKPLKVVLPIDPVIIDEIVQRIDAGELAYTVASDFARRKVTCKGRPWAVRKNNYHADHRRIMKAYAFWKKCCAGFGEGHATVARLAASSLARARGSSSGAVLLPEPTPCDSGLSEPPCPPASPPASSPETCDLL